MNTITIAVIRKNITLMMIRILMVMATRMIANGERTSLKNLAGPVVAEEAEEGAEEGAEAEAVEEEAAARIGT